MLRSSQDPEAKSIAEQELLELIGIRPNHYEYPKQNGHSCLANSTLSAPLVLVMGVANPIPSVPASSSCFGVCFDPKIPGYVVVPRSGWAYAHARIHTRDQ
ncbi:hypothetical protein N7G274_003962 [Stereocaulon virgatum]|uniref:Uncharacterized protein n=1 Tax=Stereocaulon virgatum TaxID=373712 RepID=A0ABR4AD32_9LECA